MITIVLKDGTTLDGIPVSMKAAEFRILTRQDVLIFRLVGGSWTSEDNEKVTFEFPLPGQELIDTMSVYEGLPFGQAIEFNVIGRSGPKWVN